MLANGSFDPDDFIHLIDTYVAPAQARELVDSAPPTLLVGISGAGKDTTKNALVAAGGFADIVSHTTRKPRMNNGDAEQDGVDYHFVSLNTMYDLARAGGFIELKRVHGGEHDLGDVYGTSIAALQAVRDARLLPIADIDVQGVRDYKELSDKTIAIFILPPDYDTWRERLAKRYASAAELEAEWPRRAASAVRELTEALSLPYYHFIINDDLTRTVTVAAQIARRGDVFKRADDEARLAARDLLAMIQAKV